MLIKTALVVHPILEMTIPQILADRTETYRTVCSPSVYLSSLTSEAPALTFEKGVVMHRGNIISLCMTPIPPSSLILCRYNFSQRTIEDDLRLERPLWIMSAYAPSKDVPRQLFGGHPLEQSFEEIRLLQYQAVAAGNPQAAIEAEQALAAQANQQVESALKDLRGAERYIIDGDKEHPNRIGMCASDFKHGPSQQQTNGPSVQPSGFPQPTAPAPSSFGQAAVPGMQQSNLSFNQAPFAQPANSNFGASQIPPNPAFNQGQQNAFGGLANNAFGAQPTQFGQQTTSNGVPGFGQAQPVNSGQALNQPPSQFAQFGGQANTFGQPQGIQSFSNPPSNGNTFGQPQQHPMQAGNGFPNPQPTATGFGQPASAMTTAFGTLAPPSNSNPVPFGQATQQSPDNAFGGQQTSILPAPQPNGFAPQPQVNGTSTSSLVGGIGVQNQAANTPSSGDALQDAYLYLKQHGTFKDDIMPEFPPRVEWM